MDKIYAIPTPYLVLIPALILVVLFGIGVLVWLYVNRPVRRRP